MVNTNKKIILRKKKETSKDLTIPTKDLPQVLYDYTYGIRTAEQIAEEYKTNPQTVHKQIKTFQYDLNNIRETTELVESQEVDNRFKISLDNRRIVNPSLINESFLNLLSSDNEAVLTDPEYTYVWIYVHTNNNTKALKESKLDVGILRPKGKSRENMSYVNALKLRGYYLRNKSNIQQAIQELRERKLKELNLDKDYIQSQLVSEIETMAEEGDPKTRGHRLKAIELLGKTIPGTFSETIKVEEVRPDEALDKLLEMAKADVVGTKTLPQGSQTDYVTIGE